MPQPCNICTSEDKLKIEELLRKKRRTKLISEKFGISEASINRHRVNHMGMPKVGVLKPAATQEDVSVEAHFKKWRERVKLESPESVLDFARFMMYRLERIVDRAEADGDLRTAVAAINSSLKTTTDLFAKVAGLISDAPRVDLSTKIFAVLDGISLEDLRQHLGVRPIAALTSGDQN